MHAVVMDSLEEYLSGSLEPVELRQVEAHLSNCDLCREEVRSMQDVASLFGSLRSEETFERSPNFFAEIMQAAKPVQPVRASSFAGLFALDFAFGRRLVFASLLTLAMAGTFLVTRESKDVNASVSPDAVMAQQNSPGFDSDPAPDNMLVTLTAYEH